MSFKWLAVGAIGGVLLLSPTGANADSRTPAEYAGCGR